MQYKHCLTASVLPEKQFERAVILHLNCDLCKYGCNAAAHVLLTLQNGPTSVISWPSFRDRNCEIICKISVTVQYWYFEKAYGISMILLSV